MNAIEELYTVKGLSTSTIASKMRVSQATVRKWRKQYVLPEMVKVLAGYILKDPTVLSIEEEKKSAVLHQRKQRYMSEHGTITGFQP